VTDCRRRFQFKLCLFYFRNTRSLWIQQHGLSIVQCPSLGSFRNKETCSSSFCLPSRGKGLASPVIRQYNVQCIHARLAHTKTFTTNVPVLRWFHGPLLWSASTAYCRNVNKMTPRREKQKHVPSILAVTRSPSSSVVARALPQVAVSSLGHNAK